jgi:hypothetical protein
MAVALIGRSAGVALDEDDDDEDALAEFALAADALAAFWAFHIS